MSHPQSCKDPNCALSYRDHLITINLGAKAVPTRAINRTPDQPDEPLVNALNREKRWERDIDAFKRLHQEGLRPPRVDGAALRERQGETVYDVESRPVKIDYEAVR